jgi:predicted phage terminase large subunit-like protein
LSNKESREQLQKSVQQHYLKELYKESFYDFFQDALRVIKPNDDWQFNFHHKYLCDLLQSEAYRILNKKVKQHDYLINIPPATTKSRLVSVCYNAWVWGCVSPYLTFLCISHNEELAQEFAAETKDLIQTDWYKELFPDVLLRDDKTAISNFKNTAGGGRVSFSLGAGITGFHGDFILIDDPHDTKNISDIKIQTSIKIYRETIYNRLKNPRVGLRLIIGQRVNDNDLSSYIISANDNNKYHHICLPIELTEDVKPLSLRKFYVDGVLWKERFPIESFADLTDSEMVFATQYLQKPAPAKGTLIKPEWFDTTDFAPDIDYHLFCDLAETSNKKNDPSVIMVAGFKDNTVYIKRIFEVWLEFPDLLRKITDVVQTECKFNSKVYIEPKSSGHAAIQSLRKNTQLNIIELPAVKDSKVQRVQSITPKLESRRVKLVKDNWNENFLYQCSTFPNGKHDDQVDTLYYSVNSLLSGSGKIRWYM